MAATRHVKVLVAAIVTLINYSNGAVCKPSYLKQTSFCAFCTDNEIATDSDKYIVVGMLIGSAMEFPHHHLHYGKQHWHKNNILIF